MDSWGGKWKKLRGMQGGGQGDTFLVASMEEPTRQGVLKQSNRPSSKARARMLNEVAQLNLLHEAKLKFPGVLYVGSMAGFIDDKEQALWFVMEFIEGKTLDTHLREASAFSFDHAVSLAWDLAGTMVLAHHMGVLHRDLKPGPTHYKFSKLEPA